MIRAPVKQRLRQHAQAQGQCMYDPHSLRQHAQGLLSQIAGYPQITQKLSPVDNHLQVNIQLPLRQSHWGKKCFFKGGSRSSTRNREQTQWNFGGSLPHHIRSELLIFIVLKFNLLLSIFLLLYMSVSIVFHYGSYIFT